MRRWLVLILSIGFGSSAWADVDLGRELAEAQEWEAARVQFVRAYEANPDPDLLFEIALTYQAEGLYRQARLYFERFVVEAPATDANRPEAERLAKLMQRAAERGDGEEERGRARQGDRLLPIFEDTALDLDEDEGDDDDEGEVEDDEPSDKQHTARVLFWTSAVVAAAAATTLIVAAYNVDHYEDELSDSVEDSLAAADPNQRIEGEGDACDVAESRQGIYAERAQRACDYGRSWARTANLMTAGLVATGITSMYFLYVGYLKEEPHARRRVERRAQVVPTLAPDRVALGLELRF